MIDALLKLSDTLIRNLTHSCFAPEASEESLVFGGSTSAPGGHDETLWGSREADQSCGSDAAYGLIPDQLGSASQTRAPERVSASGRKWNTEKEEVSFLFILFCLFLCLFHFTETQLRFTVTIKNTSFFCLYIQHTSIVFSH